MALSRDEKALAEEAYGRVQFARKGFCGSSFIGVFIGLAIGNSHLLAEVLRHPQKADYRAFIFVGLLIAGLAACLCVAFFLRHRFKHDEKLVHFFEQRFPDDCSWKQEESILEEAEEIRQKAEADLRANSAAR